jgi:hypothetical protein
LAHNNTVLSQILKLVCRHAFENLAKSHHLGQKLRKMSRWSQFVAMATAQLSGHCSLRDIESNLAAQTSKHYHLGIGQVTRSSLSRVNEKQPYTLYESVFGRLLARCQTRAPSHRFRFKNKLYSLEELYDTEVSATLISRVTDAALEQVIEWQSRPLDDIYPKFMC